MQYNWRARRLETRGVRETRDEGSDGDWRLETRGVRENGDWRRGE